MIGRLTLSLFLAASAISLAASAVACDSDAGGADATPTATPDGPASPTAAPRSPSAAPQTSRTVPPGLYAVDTDTGVQAVDSVLDAIAARDTDAIGRLLRFEMAPCAVDPSPVAPACEPGESPGTIVEAFRRSGCESRLLRRAPTADLMSRDLAYDWSLVGIYRLGNDGSHVILLATGSDFNAAGLWHVQVGAASTVDALYFGCGSFELPAGEIDWLLPPLVNLRPPGTGGR